MKKKFIIFSPGFREDSGGIIALHTLCNLINAENRQAYLWPAGKPRYDKKIPFISIYKIVKYWVRRHDKQYKTFKLFNTPMAKYSDLKDAIVVYPEITSGNPLLANNVVRWFLHKPGFHSGEVNYGAGELYFYYQEAFNDIKINPNPDNKLQVLMVLDDIYKQKNFGERKGTCYILRKGQNREMVHDTNESILIDGLSHEEIAKVFNSVEMCISYDLHTMYSSYAALCGCINVVVPEENLSKEEWRPEEERRYGVAYGFDDIEHAIETRSKVLPLLQKKVKESKESVRNFIVKCDDFFK